MMNKERTQFWTRLKGGFVVERSSIEKEKVARVVQVRTPHCRLTSQSHSVSQNGQTLLGEDYLCIQVYTTLSRGASIEKSLA